MFCAKNTNFDTPSVLIMLNFSNHSEISLFPVTKCLLQYSNFVVPINIYTYIFMSNIDAKTMNILFYIYACNLFLKLVSS